MFTSVHLAPVFARARAEGLAAATVRMQYSLKVEQRRELEKYWGTLATVGSHAPDFQKFILNYDDVFLKHFSMHTAADFSMHSAAESLCEQADFLLIISVTDPSEKKIVDEIVGYLPPPVKIIVQCCGEESLYQVFATEDPGSYTCVQSEPTSSSTVTLLAHQQVMWSGAIAEFDAQRVTTAFATFSDFEAAHFVAQPSLPTLEVWDFAQGQLTTLDFSEGLFVLDLFDESSRALDTGRSLNCVSVYAGGLKRTSGYGLYPMSSEHSVVQQLGLFETPTTFLIQDGQILFRGNREFLNLDVILREFLSSGKIRVMAPAVLDLSELHSLTAQYKELYNLVIGNNGFDVDFEFSAYSDFTESRQYPELYRTCVTAYVADQAEHDLARRFFNKLKCIFPNVREELVFLDPVEAPHEEFQEQLKTQEEQIRLLQQDKKLVTNELENIQKQLQESQATAKRLKIDLRDASKRASRRDAQLLQVIDKAKQQEFELAALKQTLETHKEMLLQAQRDLKEARGFTYSWNSEEVLRHLIAKDSEIAALREMLGTNTLRSPVRLPPLRHDWPLDSPTKQLSLGRRQQSEQLLHKRGASNPLDERHNMLKTNPLTKR